MTEDEMESEGEDGPAPAAPADGAVQLLHYDSLMQRVNVTSGAVALT